MSKKLVYALLVGLALSLLLASAAQAKPKPPTIEERVAALEAQVAVLTAQLQAAQSVLALAPYVSVDQNSMHDVAGPNIVFSGANVHVFSGSDAPGLGNLIVGNNEGFGGSLPGYRSGENNLVAGDANSFPGTGCFVAGRGNVASGFWTSVSGGFGNTASGLDASVSGGENNTASGPLSSVSGGYGNTASGEHASVSGGQNIILTVFNGWQGGTLHSP